MPASIELSNYYYFHQISSFCCIDVQLLLLTANDWWPRLRKIANVLLDRTSQHSRDCAG